MTTNPPDMKIRISANLRRQIEDAAKRNNRTMNGEISARLERSFESELINAASFESGKRAPVRATIRASAAPGSEYVDEQISALSTAIGERLDSLERQIKNLRAQTKE